MDIGIIGGGSIGLLIATYLVEQHQVTLYVNRKEQQDKLKSEQLQLLKASKYKKSVAITTKLITDIEDKDCLIICVKQPHIKNIISYIRKMNNKTPIIFLQNGMGHIEYIKMLQQPSYVGVVEHGAHRLNDNTVDHLGKGMIKLASVTGSERELRLLVEELHREIFPFIRSNDWSGLLKSKLIINAVINPLTALFDVPNGSIVTNGHIQFLAKQICKETASVLQLDDEASWKSVLETATITSNNVSSMRADITHNRPTEIEAISGYVLKEATEQLPYTTFVYHAILGLTYKKGTYNENSTDE